jgi:UDP-glucose 4-epimerase
MTELGRVLVTGGAGTVGSTIVDHALAARAEHVVVFDSLARGRPEHLVDAMASGCVTLVEADIGDVDALTSAMRGVDIVFHQAAVRIPLCAREPRLAFDVMVAGTFNVAQACVAAGVRKVVHASSAAVYGMASVFPTAEREPLDDNRTLYGAAKVFGESLFRSFHEMYGLDQVALRYFNVYGPRTAIRGDHKEVLVHWMERIDAGDAPIVDGDGSQTMDFVFVDDVARANILAATGDAGDEVCNVGTGVETSLLELAELLLAAMGSDRTPELRPGPGTNPVPRRVADVRRARELLGFSASVALDEGLERLVTWWRAASAADRTASMGEALR